MVRTKLPGGVDMNVNVLTSGYWPSYPVVEANLPQELSLYAQVFKEFYLAKHSGRRLVWHHSLGTCVLRAKFQKGAKELSVSLLQVRPCCRESLRAFDGRNPISLNVMRLTAWGLGRADGRADAVQRH